ncbi:MAG: DUF1385 domain-containing protein [Firmicutes bacterium]|nr:DUF1385 domain-containing protein [Bacillota bacterium]
MKKQPDFSYGGQAVIEGVMMRGRDYLAVAVRKSDGEIVIKKEPIGSVSKKFPFLKRPFIRGVVALCESFSMGLKALLFSADQFLDEGDEKETQITPWESALMIGFALLMTVVLFIILPLFGRMLASKFLPGRFWGNLFESLLRFLILIAYIVAVSFLKDIKRVFAYHGAEHKVINAFEAKKELTVGNAKGYTTFHPRCGTSFLLYVVVVSAVVFSFLKYDSILIRLASRILLLPVVAGISYEIIKFTGKNRDFFLWRWLILPGVWLQRLTTREPDNSQIEVAIRALVAVLEEEAPVIVGGKIYKGGVTAFD